jgi:tagaturonate reductase
MTRLNESFLKGRPRPTPRVLQWGEGNFLRSFVDWKIDRLNEKAGSDWGVIVLRPIAGGLPFTLNEQDGVYTVLSRGMNEAGEKVSEPRLIACVRKEMPSHEDWQGVLALAHDPNITVVVSNTTDAGIAYVPSVKFDDAPPVSFPGKLTRFLHERWTAFDGKAEAGLQMVACELIDHNGDELRRIVLQHANEWGLEPAFMTWLEKDNAFYNTLVDRIVPGFPRAEADDLAKELGYEDKFMSAAELFHFFVIERKPGMPELRIPLADYDEGTLVVDDVTPYKARKVAILNGAHTGLCALALLAGVDAVGEAVSHPAGARFLDRLLNDEVIPFLTLPKAELEEFAAAVLRRFQNPYIRHLWYDISLNGIVKYQTRNLERLLAYDEKFGTPAPLMTLSLASWLAFYLGRFQGSETLPPRDSADMIERIGSIAAADGGTDKGLEAMVAAYLQEIAFWGRSIDTPRLRTKVIEDFRYLTEQPFSFARLQALLDRA